MNSTFSAFLKQFRFNDVVLWVFEIPDILFRPNNYFTNFKFRPVSLQLARALFYLLLSSLFTLVFRDSASIQDGIILTVRSIFSGVILIGISIFSVLMFCKRNYLSSAIIFILMYALLIYSITAFLNWLYRVDLFFEIFLILRNVIIVYWLLFLVILIPIICIKTIKNRVAAVISNLILINCIAILNLSLYGDTLINRQYEVLESYIDPIRDEYYRCQELLEITEYYPFTKSLIQFEPSNSEVIFELRNLGIDSSNFSIKSDDLRNSMLRNINLVDSVEQTIELVRNRHILKLWKEYFFIVKLEAEKKVVIEFDSIIDRGISYDFTQRDPARFVGRKYVVALDNLFFEELTEIHYEREELLAFSNYSLLPFKFSYLIFWPTVIYNLI